MKSITITAAKAVFDQLVAEVEASGNPVTITRSGRPVAVLAALASRPRPFGQLGTLVVPDSFDEPLPESEMSGWEGEP